MVKVIKNDRHRVGRCRSAVCGEIRDCLACRNLHILFQPQQCLRHSELEHGEPDRADQHVSGETVGEVFVRRVRYRIDTADQRQEHQDRAKAAHHVIARCHRAGLFHQDRSGNRAGHVHEDEAEAGKKEQPDFLHPILKKLSLPLTGVLEEGAAIKVKMEALKSLKERLLTRAEIIQRRLETEQKNLDDAYQKLKRRGEAFV